MTGQVLSSWKEIAAYLGKGVRTVQRWEAEMGLPVRRPGPERHIVVAIPAELDEWVRAGRKRESLQAQAVAMEVPNRFRSSNGRDASERLKQLRGLMQNMLIRVSVNRDRSLRLLQLCERYAEKSRTKESA